jgi:hypothetical protein
LPGFALKRETTRALPSVAMNSDLVPVQHLADEFGRRGHSRRRARGLPLSSVQGRRGEMSTSRSTFRLHAPGHASEPTSAGIVTMLSVTAIIAVAERSGTTCVAMAGADHDEGEFAAGPSSSAISCARRAAEFHQRQGDR